MTSFLAAALFCAAATGLAAVAVQCMLLRRHLRAARLEPTGATPISVLKPLCGVDDGLEENLASFAAIEHPGYEVLLGVRSPRDPAWAIACAAVRRWPDRFRLVVQRGEPGQNPKVNQLVTLARAARHEVLVISDSNVRVDPGYLTEIAALLDDEAVGLVTHLIVGAGEQRLGSVMDHLHLAGSISPAIVAARPLMRRDVVVGKSMALRRRDLAAVGGFEAVKDVLAEDHVLGELVTGLLGKRVAIAHCPVQNTSERRTVRQFAARYARWGVLQRQAAGPLLYGSYALLNPVLLAGAGAALQRTPAALAGFLCTCAARSALDAAAVTALRPGRVRLAHLAVSPLKDLVFGAAWAYGLARRKVVWRGNRIVVGPGTRIASPQLEAAHGSLAAAIRGPEGIHGS